MSQFEVVTVILGIVGLSLNLIVVVGAIVQLRYLRIQISETRSSIVQSVARERIRATIDFYSNTLESRSAMQDGKLPNVYDPREVRRWLASLDAEDLRRLNQFLGYWETFATGVNSGAFDIEVVNRLTGTRLRHIWTSYEPWIRQRRVHRETPTLYNELERLASEIGRQRGSDA